RIDALSPSGGSIRKEMWQYLPARWQRAFGQAASDRVTEGLCTMYVAITRAKHHVYLVIPPETKSAVTKKGPATPHTTMSMAGLIYHALDCPGDAWKANTVLWTSDSEVS
ncbi:MAG: hypothetical protein AAF664_03745, partial [Planctomycetota bacterium]